LAVLTAVAVPAPAVSATSLTGPVGGLPAIVPVPGFVFNLVPMLDFVLHFMFHLGPVAALDRHAEPDAEPDLGTVPKSWT
jgi:hypothetical protein